MKCNLLLFIYFMLSAFFLFDLLPYNWWTFRLIIKCLPFFIRDLSRGGGLRKICEKVIQQTVIFSGFSEKIHEKFSDCQNISIKMPLNTPASKKLNKTTAAKQVIEHLFCVGPISFAVVYLYRAINLFRCWLFMGFLYGLIAFIKKHDYYWWHLMTRQDTISFFTQFFFAALSFLFCFNVIWSIEIR